MDAGRADPTRRAVAAALAFIARRDHTAAELGRKLAAKGFDPDTAAAALARCRELGYLDDDATGRRMAAALRRRGLGVHRIRAQLREKGLGADRIERLTREDEDPDTALAAARAACRARQAAFDRERDPTRRRAKIYRFLQSRGFPSEAIHRLLHE